MVTCVELCREAARLASVLLNLGAGPGDRVTIYLPAVPEMVTALPAAFRAGAIHSVVFGDFTVQRRRTG